jgi:predicted unusual protein kinase regulating ubiquinone biosynthesis (AarF/ABC1/UbiB family)
MSRPVNCEATKHTPHHKSSHDSSNTQQSRVTLHTVVDSSSSSFCVTGASCSMVLQYNYTPCSKEWWHLLVFLLTSTIVFRRQEDLWSGKDATTTSTNTKSTPSRLIFGMDGVDAAWVQPFQLSSPPHTLSSTLSSLRTNRIQTIHKNNAFAVVVDVVPPRPQRSILLHTSITDETDVPPKDEKSTDSSTIPTLSTTTRSIVEKGEEPPRQSPITIGMDDRDDYKNEKFKVVEDGNIITPVPKTIPQNAVQSNDGPSSSSTSNDAVTNRNRSTNSIESDIQTSQSVDLLPEKRRIEYSSSSGTTSSGVSSRRIKSRAIQYITTTWNDLVYPIGYTLWNPNMAVPTNWDDFFNMPLLLVDSNKVDNGKNDSTNNNNNTITTTTTTGTTVADQFTSYLEHLGPTFVKFGQAISSRPDIVHRSLAVALSRLQDQMDTSRDGLDDVTVITRILQNELWPTDDLTNDNESSIDQPPHRTNSNVYFPSQNEWDTFIGSLSSTPIAAASIGVVYSAILPLTNQKVAIKIQRPGIGTIVQQDSELLLWMAQVIESIPSLSPLFSYPSFVFRKQTDEIQQQPPRRRLPLQSRMIQTDLSGAVKEFMSRIVEELDYTNEAKNLEIFANLYSHRRHHHSHSHPPPRRSINDDQKDGSSDGNKNYQNQIQVVVPKVYRELCTDKVLVMEWIDGIKLVELERNNDDTNNTGSKPLSNNNDDDDLDGETLELIKQGIDCTLSQLLETGVLHADPHGGNLLKVMIDDDDIDHKDYPPSTSHNNNKKKKQKNHGRKGTPQSRYRLGYVDFGLLSTIPPSVQEGLICAVAQLVFARNVSAVANLFGDLQLMPQSVLDDPSERAALAIELEQSLSQVLVYPSSSPSNEDDTTSSGARTTVVPNLRFDKLLDVLSRLVPRFQFQLPPYFLNNARAIGTLEGMARQVDPTFNIIQILYPYAIRRIVRNPTGSAVIDDTLNSLIEDPITKRVDPTRIKQLLDGVSALTGQSKRRIVRDVITTRNGKKLIFRWIQERSGGSTSLVRTLLVDPGKARLEKMVQYLRL